MATTSKRTIHLLGQPVYNEDGAAGEVITPGMLVKGVTTVTKQSTADARCAVAVALEREEMGLSIDDTYAVDDTVKVGVYKAGGRFLGWLASGQNVAEGALLAPNAAGLLKAGAATAAVARALEAIDASSGDTRIRVEALP